MKFIYVFCFLCLPEVASSMRYRHIRSFQAARRGSEAGGCLSTPCATLSPRCSSPGSPGGSVSWPRSFRLRAGCRSCPCRAMQTASEDFHAQGSFFQIELVQVGDFVLAACRRTQRSRLGRHRSVVEVEARHGVVAARMFWLFPPARVLCPGRRTRRHRMHAGPSRSSQRCRHLSPAQRRGAAWPKSLARRTGCRPE